MTSIFNRRHFLVAAAAAFASSNRLSAQEQVPPKPASPVFVTARDALAAGRPIGRGRVHLELPPLAENGNSVTLKVAVDSPMTPADHVKIIHLLSEQNPIATMARFHLQPRSGRAFVSTSVRLASTQNVHAIAEMSDGSLWFDSAQSIVLLAACVDGG
jgi:sulfur-oxidizing protein SoxY